MPTYTVTHPQTGKVVKVTGDTMPTEAELDGIFAATSGGETDRQTQIGKSAPLTPKEASDFAKNRDAFINTGTTTTKLKEKGLDFARKAAPYVRPVLEVGGAVGGGILATPETAGVGTVPGVALGYAMGKNVADNFDEAIGLKQPEPLLQRFATTGNDLATGATMEMGGQLVGKGINYGLRQVAKAKTNGLPFTPKANTAKAARVWEEVNTTSPEAAANNAARQAETDNLLTRIDTEAQPTVAQTTGNVKAAGLEQSLAAKDPALMERLKYNDAQLAADAQQNMLNAIGPAAPPLPVVSANAHTTGAGIDAAIDSAKEPIVQAERAIWGEVPDYVMPSHNFEATAADLAKTPMVKAAEDTVNSVLSFAHRVPKTVQGLQSIDRTISSEISKAVRSGDNETARALGTLKDSLKADFDAMGEAAVNGDVALSADKLVYPSKLQHEAETLHLRLAEEQARKQVTPDVDAIVQALRDKGAPPNVWMKQIGESPNQFSARLMKDYQNQIGAEIPTIGAAPSQTETAIQERLSQIAATLDNLQPAEDVAQKYAAAKAFSRQEKFDRFNVGAVKDVTSKGNQSTGQRLPLEAIPAKMFTPSGARDLVRALTPMQGEGMTAEQAAKEGIKAAGEQMWPHVMQNLSNARIIDADGVLNVPRAMAYIRQNKETLNALGLTQKTLGMVKEQIPGAVKSALEKAADKGVDVLGNPTMTARQAAKLWRDYGPAWKAAGGDARALQAMKDYQTMIVTLGRNKSVSYSGNSTTIEKLFGDAPAGSLARRMVDNLSGAIIGGSTGAAIGGPVGAAVGGTAGIVAKTAFDTAVKHSAEAVQALLKDAIINPETAQMLMNVAKGQKIAPKQISSRLATLGVYPFVKAISTPASDPLGIRPQ